MTAIEQRRRPLCRGRRLLRPPGRGRDGFHRCRAPRSAARTSRHALWQEHHGGRHQRHHQEAGVRAVDGCRSELRQSGYFRPRVRRPARSRIRWRIACRSRHAARWRLYNTTFQDDLNDLNNIGARLQLLWEPSDTLSVRFIRNTVQRPEGYGTVFVGVVPTQRLLNRQLRPRRRSSLISLPASIRSTASSIPIRRTVPIPTSAASRSRPHGISTGTLTSVSAWRYWIWGIAERPRLPRSADHHPLATPVEAIPVATRTALRRQFRRQHRLRRRRFLVQPGHQDAGPAGAGFCSVALPSQPDAAGATTPGLLDGMATGPIFSPTTPARRCSAT